MEKYVDRKYILEMFKIRKDDCNKSDCGKVLVYAGSRGYYGAAYLTTRAATRTGSGLVSLICDHDVQKVNAIRLIEEMTCSIEESVRVNKLLRNADAVAFGPGMGNTPATKNKLENLLNKYKGPLVIDADGINVLDRNFIDINKRTILTPHLGEFSRLIGVGVEEIKSNRVKYSKEFAKKASCIIVLKGKNTIITNGEDVYINTTGNPGMANGGMGDTLTGMITSLCGQGYDIFKAAIFGVYLHGLCGDYIYEDNFTVNANDLNKVIPKIMKMIYNDVKK